MKNEIYHALFPQLTLIIKYWLLIQLLAKIISGTDIKQRFSKVKQNMDGLDCNGWCVITEW